MGVGLLVLLTAALSGQGINNQEYALLFINEDLNARSNELYSAQI